MPKYQDATGYLLEQRNSLGQSWYNLIVDLALNSTGENLKQENLELIWNVLIGSEAYTPQAAMMQPSNVSVNNSESIFLETLSAFDGFKKLSPNLSLNLSRQVTLIFGSNGSGKSSLCGAVKVLSNPEHPENPLHNARSPSQTSPQFSYKFKSDNTLQTWNKDSGYGTLAQSIKYFDSSIALSNTSQSLKPENTIEVEVFRIEIFEYLRNFLHQFQLFGQQKVSTTENSISQKIDSTKQLLCEKIDTNAEPFSSWSVRNSQSMADWVRTFQFNNEDDEKLRQTQESLKNLEAATSEKGLKHLQSKYALISQLEQKLNNLVTLIEGINIQDLRDKQNILSVKKAALSELTQAIYPKEIAQDNFHTFMHNAISTFPQNFLNLSSETECPLCRQNLDQDAIQLFRKYHEILTSNIQSEVTTLEQEIEAGHRQLKSIQGIQLEDKAIYINYLNESWLSELFQAYQLVKTSIPQSKSDFTSISISQFEQHHSLKNLLLSLKQDIADTKNIIDKATTDKQQIQQQINQTNNIIAQMIANKALVENKDNILEI